MFKKIQKYMMGCVDGSFGDGKTVFLVMLAVETYMNYENVYANFILKNIPNFIYLPKINKPILLNLKPKSLFLMTESYINLDRRECMKRKNIDTTHAIFQIRKTEIDHFYDIPDCDYLDFRYRDYMNFFMRAKGQFSKTHFGYCHLKYNKMSGIYEEGELMIKDMSKYFEYFDTKEIIDKQVLLQNFEK